MPKKYKTPKLILRYEGVFEFKTLYRHIVNWFKTKNYDYIEKGWKEKDSSPQGREITVKMIPEKKINEYIKYAWSIEWKSVDAHYVGEQSDNQMHARFHIHVQATLIEDWQDLGKGQPKISELFTKHVFKREREYEYMQELENLTQELLDEVKQQVGMQATKL